MREHALGEILAKTQGHCHFCGDPLVFENRGWIDQPDGHWEVDHVIERGAADRLGSSKSSAEGETLSADSRRRFMLSTGASQEESEPPSSWLAVLGPVGECHLEPVIPGSDLLVWHANLEFVPWIPPLPSPKLSWSETYGKSLMARDDGSWTVAEIELVRRFRNAGWQAGWVDTWGKAPRKWSEWIVTPESLPLPLGSSYRVISNAVGPDGSGSPDVIAWRDGSIANAVFVESKMKD
jgi:hypothetical protein